MLAGLTAALRQLAEPFRDASDLHTHVKVIRMTMESGTATTRVIRPLGLWFWGNVWTLVGWCELRDDFRMFRADRMSVTEAQGRFREERGKRLSDFYAAHRRDADDPR